jgi:uncharacterized damage-inducible protein DinB
MITPAHVRLMARYNAWQNDNLYTAADGLTDEDRRRDRGAFFGSIHATFNHLMYGDRIWMHRFSGTPKPPQGSIKDSLNLIADWTELKAQRVAFDAAIVAWADQIDAEWLGGDLTYYSGAAHREFTKPRGMLVTHFFNHQTHHRGQVHCMLTQCGVRPGDTDLPFLTS